MPLFTFKENPNPNLHSPFPGPERHPQRSPPSPPSSRPPSRTPPSAPRSSRSSPTKAPRSCAARRRARRSSSRPRGCPLWIRYFSNANILYAINNTLGAEALTRVLPAAAAEVLEIGGGCGSAAEAALSRASAPRVARWRFTELVPTFARRGERAARAAAAPGTLVEAAKLDMTKPWAEQGVVPGSFDAVYSVNCFHVAPDLGFVLAEARAALKPGGVVVVSECVKPGAHPPPSYVDFVFDFLTSFTDVKTDPVLRPNHGFLSPAAWRASFAAAGFHGVEVLPDVDAVAARFPKFFVGAVVAGASRSSRWQRAHSSASSPRGAAIPRSTKRGDVLDDLAVHVPGLLVLGRRRSAPRPPRTGGSASGTALSAARGTSFRARCQPAKSFMLTW